MYHPCKDSVSEAVTSDRVSVVMARGSNYEPITELHGVISTVGLSASYLHAFRVANLLAPADIKMFSVYKPGYSVK